MTEGAVDNDGFKLITIDGMRVAYIEEDIEGFPSLKRYQIAIDIDGKYEKVNVTCEEVSFENKLEEIVFIQKLKAKK